jgi:hypothetical protein
MEDLDVDVIETEWLEDQILTLFEGKRDFILMSALTMVTAKVIVSQKKRIPTLDVDHVLDMADEQLRFTVNGVLREMRKAGRGEN